jgi:hypothetical protein
VITRITAAFVALALVAAAIFAYQHKVAEVDRLSAVVTAYKVAKQADTLAIAQLQNANDKCSAENAANLKQAKTEFDRMRDYAFGMQAERDKALSAVRVVYEHEPKSKAWADVAIPASVAEWVRRNAGHSDQDR